VYGWLTNEHTDAPPQILEQHGFDEVAHSLRGFARLPHETRGSVFFTARAATACLRNPAIMGWVTPPASSDIEGFEPSSVIGTRQTVYLLSKDSGGSAAPLVAALADALIRAGIAGAEARGGRLDPPMAVVLDEAASVAPIADLPLLVSHAGSRAIFVMTILQSYPQGEAVWQTTGMKALWSASTIKVVGPGQDDAGFNESVSKLLGEQWVTTGSWSAGEKATHASTTVSRQKVMDAGAVRALAKGTALLIATGHRPALLRLNPWYDGPLAAELTAAEQELAARISTAAASPVAPATDTAPRPVPEVQEGVA
jgi:type IV secretory pathway TraG/TraD family ATPase VirD4